MVKEYSEDGNETGELDWFYQGLMVEDFDKIVRNQQPISIFEVDVVEENWNYVVLKTEENKHVECTFSINIKVIE